MQSAVLDAKAVVRLHIAQASCEALTDVGLGNNRHSPINNERKRALANSLVKLKSREIPETTDLLPPKGWPAPRQALYETLVEEELNYAIQGFRDILKDRTGPLDDVLKNYKLYFLATTRVAGAVGVLTSEEQSEIEAFLKPSSFTKKRREIGLNLNLDSIRAGQSLSIKR